MENLRIEIYVTKNQSASKCIRLKTLTPVILENEKKYSFHDE